MNEKKKRGNIVTFILGLMFTSAGIFWVAVDVSCFFDDFPEILFHMLIGIVFFLGFGISSILQYFFPDNKMFKGFSNSTNETSRRVSYTDEEEDKKPKRAATYKQKTKRAMTQQDKINKESVKSSNSPITYYQRNGRDIMNKKRKRKYK